MYVEMGNNIFAENLHYLRTSYELPLKALSKLIEMDEEVLRGIEEQTTPAVLPVDAFFRICHVFGIDSKVITTVALSYPDED